MIQDEIAKHMFLMISGRSLLREKTEASVHNYNEYYYEELTVSGRVMCEHILSSTQIADNSKTSSSIGCQEAKYMSQGTDISQKDEKPIKKRQNRTRDGK
ncbi:hypothetical protein Tco_1039298, partial [Tanacetum coccineum]